MEEHTNSDEEEGGEGFRLGLSINLDRDDFLRRTCPSCGRDFKTEADQADIEWAIGSQVRRVGAEIGADLQTEVEPSHEHLTCPYCCAASEASETLPEEAINYVRRFAVREIVTPLLNRMFGDLEDSIDGGSGGFISVSFKHTRGTDEPRPIHGPDAPDMKIVEFLCCGERAKVADEWRNVSLCIYCNTEVTLV